MKQHEYTSQYDEYSDRNRVRPKSRTTHKTLASLTSIIRRIVKGDRFKHLAAAITLAVENVNRLVRSKTNILDYGCGSMEMAQHLHKFGAAKSVLCVDIYDPPEHKSNNPCITYQKIDEFEKQQLEKKFDIAIVIDVLHHADINQAVPMLKRISKDATYVIVKDHFEYGFISRQILRIADCFGNFAYGVSIPKKYFTKDFWNNAVKDANLEEVELKSKVKIYDGLFGMILRPKYHFISVLRHKT